MDNNKIKLVLMSCCAPCSAGAIKQLADGEIPGVDDFILVISIEGGHAAAQTGIIVKQAEFIVYTGFRVEVRIASGYAAASLAHAEHGVYLYQRR